MILYCTPFTGWLAPGTSLAMRSDTVLICSMLSFLNSLSVETDGLTAYEEKSYTLNVMGTVAIRSSSAQEIAFSYVV